MDRRAVELVEVESLHVVKLVNADFITLIKQSVPSLSLFT